MQTDSVIQSFFAVLKSIKWRDCETDVQFEWYYAESMHYVIHNKETNAYWFVKAKSPASACETVIKKMKGDS